LSINNISSLKKSHSRYYETFFSRWNIIRQLYFQYIRHKKLWFSLQLLSSNNVTSDTLQFYNCQCIGQNVTILPEAVSTASIGYCQLECSNFWVYMILFSVFVFIHSTSEVGSMLLILRCVDPRDKAMALGLIQFAIGLFGNYLQEHLYQ